MGVLAIDGTALSGATGYAMQVANTTVAEENASGGDTVSLSAEAKSLSAAALKTQDSGDSSGSDAAELIKNIQERIKELQKEIEAVKSDPSLSEEQKKTKLAALQSELMTLQSELLQAQSASGGSSMGGTSAEGFANSLT
ncbi:MAG TPA: hypothetical protein DD766_06955 [Desulfovibrio sp.]|nr:hypothetical protein [Desulfovibrio sp.]